MGWRRQPSFQTLLSAARLVAADSSFCFSEFLPFGQDGPIFELSLYPANALAGGASDRSSESARSAADLAGDDVTEQLPLLALEAHELQLVDRGEIGRRGVDRDAGQ